MDFQEKILKIASAVLKPGSTEKSSAVIVESLLQENNYTPNTSFVVSSR